MDSGTNNFSSSASMEPVEYAPLIHDEVRNEMRRTIESEMELFLKKGGSITHIDDHVMADPPTKPKSGYGKTAI